MNCLRRFFVHCIGVIPIRINLVLVNDGNSIFLGKDFTACLTEHFEITCTQIDTINIVIHCHLPFLMLTTYDFP